MNISVIFGKLLVKIVIKKYLTKFLFMFEFQVHFFFLKTHVCDKSNLAPFFLDKCYQVHVGANLAWAFSYLASCRAPSRYRRGHSANCAEQILFYALVVLFRLFGISNLSNMLFFWLSVSSTRKSGINGSKSWTQDLPVSFKKFLIFDLFFRFKIKKYSGI